MQIGHSIVESRNRKRLLHSSATVELGGAEVGRSLFNVVIYYKALCYQVQVEPLWPAQNATPFEQKRFLFCLLQVGGENNWHESSCITAIPPPSLSSSLYVSIHVSLLL